MKFYRFEKLIQILIPFAALVIVCISAATGEEGKPTKQDKPALSL